MPIKRLIDRERRVVECAFIGAVTRDEIVQHRQALEVDDPDALGFDALIDMRRGSLALSTGELREVARGAAERQWPAARCAFVTAYEPAFNDVRLFEIWGSRGPREYRAFHSLGEACEWLGVDRAGLCLEELAVG